MVTDYMSHEPKTSDNFKFGEKLPLLGKSENKADKEGAINSGRQN